MTAPDARCEVTELPQAMCAHCRKIPDSPRQTRALGPWFSATYPGRCSDCDDRFEEHDSIRADGEGGYLCAGCGAPS